MILVSLRVCKSGDLRISGWGGEILVFGKWKVVGRAKMGRLGAGRAGAPAARKAMAARARLAAAFCRTPCVHDQTR